MDIWPRLRLRLQKSAPTTQERQKNPKSQEHVLTERPLNPEATAIFVLQSILM